ncbi:diguanylate cyclase [Pseudoalteromonas sp. McH1-7]|uniref:sensor domain-containing diguanylate cyclase n=1 Tax=unclassified Pseudoalteromonas TaxID=194690 RepID=UPI000FFE9613|nr:MULTISPECIES: diguanylate cyclase [unclassified Pseudoalteromonas]NUZ12346.1 diguanylate cyclase [Pseudoalteromonas sp. McH1-7]RXF02077.1 diguanylate cyclase [Pseudoalteromonas sp. PS5]
MLSLLLLLSSFIACSAVTISESFDAEHRVKLDYTLSKYASLNELLSEPVEWHQSARLPTGLRPNKKYLWLKIELHNASSAVKPILVSINNNLLDAVTAYHVRPNHPILTVDSGDALPLIKRPLKYEALIVPLELQPQTQSQLYLQLSDEGVINAPITIWEPNAYLKHKSKFNLIFGILAGFILALALTNVTLYNVTRKRYFLYATVFTSLVWLLNAHLYGFGYRYFYSSWQWFQQYGQGIMTLSLSLLLLPQLHFCSGKQLLSHPTLSDSWVKLVVVLLFIGIITLPVSFSILLALSVSLIITILLTYSVARLTHPRRNALLAVLLCHFILVSYPLTVEVGIQSGSFLHHVGYFGIFTLETTLLCYLVVHLYIHQRDEKLASQQRRLAHTQAEDALLKEKLKLQEQAQYDLESSIESRTFELQVTLRELEDKNRELERMNMEDPLTKVKNRGYFDKRLQMEARRSRREQTVLSLIIFDIDHFKKINDQYGHLAGDQAICEFANLIKSHLRRPHDEVFRYGGEEFILLLPNTSEAGACEVAERVRMATAELVIEIGEHQLTMTTSAGVYSAIVSDPHNPQLYTDNADKALYQAKQQGRNRVITFQTNQEN